MLPKVKTSTKVNEQLVYMDGFHVKDYITKSDDATITTTDMPEHIHTLAHGRRSDATAASATAVRRRGGNDYFPLPGVPQQDARPGDV